VIKAIFKDGAQLDRVVESAFRRPKLYATSTQPAERQRSQLIAN